MSKPLPILTALAGLALLAGCTDVYKLPHQVDSFKVEIKQVKPITPPAETGESPEKALPIPLDPVSFLVTVTAYDEQGQVMTDFSRPVSFRSTPGTVKSVTLEDGTIWADRVLPMVNGTATGWVVVDKVFGETRIWAQDAAPEPIYTVPVEGGADGGTAAVDAGRPPAYVESELDRTFAASASNVIYFVKPTITDVQLSPATCTQNTYGTTCKVDTTTSPFVTNFLTIDAPFPRGDMIVTSITNEGFYVTDMAAQRYDRAPYSDALGTFGHIFVYNYSYPDGLYLGDRINSLTGTVQEFSGATQLVFPSWVRVQGNPKPEDIPAPLVLDFSTPPSAASSTTLPSSGYRVCKPNTKVLGPDPAIANTNVMCGYSTNNVDIESLESSLIKMVNIKPSDAFVNCDSNGNANIGLFGQCSAYSTTPCEPYTWTCFTEGEDAADCECYRDCIIGNGQFAGKVCTELNSLETYGQWLVQVEDTWKMRLNVSTRDALPEFDPRDLAKPEHQGCRFDITGILRQTQAARPRWIVFARDEADVCCHKPADPNLSCPKGVNLCQAEQ